jgi:hypothetical protein
MPNVSSSGRRRVGARLRIALVGATAAGLFAAFAAPAGATVEVANHTDPAGDPTPIGYVVQTPVAAAAQFALGDGQFKAFGPFEGQVTMQVVLPAGWVVTDVQCVGPNPADFAIDVPHGHVTITHHIADEQFCSFTNRRAAATSPPLPGVAAAPPQAVLPKVNVSDKPALLKVTPGRRGFVLADVRVARRSTIRGQLLYRGRVVGTGRAVVEAGNRRVTLGVTDRFRQQMRRQHLKRVQLTLRLVIVDGAGAPAVIRYRLILRL